MDREPVSRLNRDQFQDGEGAALSAWYRAVARPLPWRASATPYHVLLSELMSQQTRIATMLPYYEAFLERWPSLDALASAEEHEVVEQWAGLGYYSRARNLHRAAVVAVSLGGLPTTSAELRKLPGIGPYTAGAIASIAFGERTPAVDGNVNRVISRYLRIDERIDSASSRRRVHGLVMTALSQKDLCPGEINQGLMELGAVVCVPISPACGTCPLAGGCRALATGDQASYPKKRARVPPRPVRGSIAVIQGSLGVLFVRRRARKLLGGLWGPVFALDCACPKEQVLDEVRSLNLQVVSVRRVGEIRHVFSHLDVRAEVIDVRVVGTAQPTQQWTEVCWNHERSGMSRLAEKALELYIDDEPMLAAEPGEASSYCGE